MKMIKKFAHESAFKSTDTTVEKIGIFYGFNNYGCTLQHINELKNAVLIDFPDMKDEDIEVWKITTNQSLRNAQKTMLHVMIPYDTFKKFNEQNLINML